MRKKEPQSRAIGNFLVSLSLVGPLDLRESSEKLRIACGHHPKCSSEVRSTLTMHSFALSVSGGRFRYLIGNLLFTDFSSVSIAIKW